jgi:DNA-binding GntR family transcriptional regulator
MVPSMSQIVVEPIEANFSLKDRIYATLKDAIGSMNIYADDAELKLDERRLSERLGISRTPLREALARLEQEGLVTIVPRRGVYIVRKSKRQVLEMITVWAALESMAARLVTKLATTREIDSLRRLFGDFQGGEVEARIDEYSERNIAFHQTILDLSRCELLRTTADGLFLHMRGIRVQTIGEEDRAARSIIDHMSIIEVIERRETELAEKLVREHALKLAEHVERHVDYLN